MVGPDSSLVQPWYNTTGNNNKDVMGHIKESKASKLEAREIRGITSEETEIHVLYEDAKWLVNQCLTLRT